MRPGKLYYWPDGVELCGGAVCGDAPMSVVPLEDFLAFLECFFFFLAFLGVLVPVSPCIPEPDGVSVAVPVVPPVAPVDPMDPVDWSAAQTIPAKETATNVLTRQDKILFMEDLLSL
jgi:hypothetical protein